ncbi:hypothetical protein CQ10_08335 [Bradyrhizobium valentinum]|uniref:Uncharacterized protein n=1 Tax=Bradyrhizobium valentinum TaxID=1518501 RepID=A0A0R3KRA8_9BRAD|nr:hypothetical protein CQ10_08335 [Bradyrhizobium valentinum]KRQ98112.1 hypothetical protein CP49_30240 [Bradyrhizobium valentinum]
MFGWTNPKMPAHHIAKARRDKLGASGMEKLVSFDHSQNGNIGALVRKTAHGLCGTAGASRVDLTRA